MAVRVQAAELRPIAERVSALGKCEALPAKQAMIAPIIEGQVVALLAKQGDSVTAGQPIVQLDKTLAQAEVVEKQAACDNAIAALAVLKSLPRAEERRSAELAFESSKVALEKAQALVERLRPLRERNEIPQSQLFDAEEAAKEARLQQQSAEAQLNLLTLGPRPEIIAEAESKINVAKEALKTAQSRLALLTLKSPIDGVLSSLACRPGQTCAVGTSVAEVIDSREILAAVWLPVGRSGLIHVGSAARIYLTFESSKNRHGTSQTAECAGKVVYVGRNADAQTGNVAIRVLVDNKDSRLVIGQTISADITIGEPAESLCVPLTAVRDDGDGSAITIVRDGKTSVLHPKMGINDGTWIAVHGSDLKSGELVAVSGVYNLPEGTAVEVAKEAAEPTATK